jgi:hypothetical protein
VRTNRAEFDAVQFVRVDGQGDAVPALRTVRGLRSGGFSPDGGRYAVAVNREARVYSVEPGTAKASRGDGLRLRHDGLVVRVEFSPDGLRLLTITDEELARIWDAHSGALLVGPIPNPQRPGETAFSRDGQRLATADGDGKARFWLASPAWPAGWGSAVQLAAALRAVGVLPALRLAAWLTPYDAEVLNELARATRADGAGGDPTALSEADYLERLARELATVAALPSGRERGAAGAK